MIAAIVQARMGSSRLRGKVLEDLAGQPVIARVLARAARIPGVDAVCCATVDSVDNDAIAAAAAGAGAVVFRGSEDDVLARYAGAAAMLGADVVMRLTCDCPFLDWMVSGGVLAAFLDAGADYASNLDPRSWPKGLDTEVMTRAAMEEAAARAEETGDREHVTPYIRRAPHFARVSTICSEGDFASWRWTLDYPEDLVFCRAVMERVEGDLPTFAEVRAVVEAEPEIAALNAGLA